MNRVTALLDAAYPTRAEAVLGACTLIEGWIDSDPPVAEKIHAANPDASYEQLHGLLKHIRKRLERRAHRKGHRVPRRKRRRAQRQARRRARL